MEFHGDFFRNYLAVSKSRLDSDTSASHCKQTLKN
jgi:hypothetical protein